MSLSKVASVAIAFAVLFLGNAGGARADGNDDQQGDHDRHSSSQARTVPAPEPLTIAGLVLGAGGLVAMRLRRKQRA